MNAFSQTAAYGVGRMVTSDVYGGREGTIVKVRAPSVADPYPSYDIAWQDGTGVEKVSQLLLQGSTWKVLPKVLPKVELEDLHRKYLDTKLRIRTEAALMRLGSSTPAASSVSFYRPSEASLRSLHPSLTDIKVLNGTPVNIGPSAAALAAKGIRAALANEYEGIRFSVATKGDVVNVSWTDGPVFISQVTDKFSHGHAQSPADNSLPHAGQVAVRRDVSDFVTEMAIEYVRQFVDGVADESARLSAAAFKSGALRDVYPRSNSANSGLSIGRLVRVLLLRWDDYALRFVPEGITRAMIMENEALFPGKDMSMANARMRTIRSSLIDHLNESTPAAEEAENHFQRES